jgi:hypothetical protein
MNSKERILSACRGLPLDHVPLTTWCFGLKPKPTLRWVRDNIERTFWYSLRMEHIHTLPQPWDLEDDFRRALAWRSLGVDDVLDVSTPWGHNPAVTWEDHRLPAGSSYAGLESSCPIAERIYHTPSGELRHAVRLTGEETAPGWTVQPETVPLFEDYNIPRGLKHLISQPEDIAAFRHLYQAPDATGQAWLEQRLQQVRQFAERENIAVQAWSAFGMDGVVWVTGVQNAVMLAMDAPEAFKELVEIIFQADYARTRLTLLTPGVDLIVQRGWYSSTDFWSPRLFERFVFPYLVELAKLVHSHDRLFAYVMTTGVEKLGPRLAEAGVDVLYFADPLQDGLSLDWARHNLADRMTLVGGANALTLASGNPARIRQEVHQAFKALGNTNRFILHPLDAIFPDTPWDGVEGMIKAWKEVF